MTRHSETTAASWFRTTANGVQAYAVWFLLVLGAARGEPSAASALAAALVVVQIVFHPQRGKEGSRVLVLAVLGTVIDTLLIRSGVYTPAGHDGFLCPLWISLLWANFATTVDSSLAFLRGRPFVAAVLGAIAGPLSYAAAARLGAAEIHPPIPLHYGVLAAIWGLLMTAVFGGRRPVLLRAAATTGLVLACTSASAREREIAGVTFPEAMQVGEVRLRLVGVGVLRYRLVFTGYAAALYVGEGISPARILEDVPKRLEIHYFWSIPAEAFVQASEQFLAQNVAAEKLQTLRSRVEQIHRAYESVRPGDRYALTYVPGSGTELTLNGVPKVRIPGADFASAYFAIWLGERPISEDLKRALLAGRG